MPFVEGLRLIARKRKLDFEVGVGQDEQLVIGGNHAESPDVLGVAHTGDLRKVAGNTRWQEGEVVEAKEKQTWLEVE